MTTSDIAQRITDYLSGGGLYKPELANHDAVRDLLIECRSALDAIPPPEGAREPRLDDFDQPIVYDTREIDEITHALTGDEGEDDSVTILHGLIRYLGIVHPGKTMTQVLVETEDARSEGDAVAALRVSLRARHSLPAPTRYPLVGDLVEVDGQIGICTEHHKGWCYVRDMDDNRLDFICDEARHGSCGKTWRILDDVLAAHHQPKGTPVMWQYRLRLRASNGHWTDWSECTEASADEYARATCEQWEYETRALGVVGAAQSPAVGAVPTTALNPNEDDACALWAEIHRLSAAVRGPSGFESWQEAATAERVRRVAAEKALAAVQAPAAAPQAQAAQASNPQPTGMLNAPHGWQIKRDGDEGILITAPGYSPVTVWPDDARETVSGLLWKLCGELLAASSPVPGPEPVALPPGLSRSDAEFWLRKRGEIIAALRVEGLTMVTTLNGVQFMRLGKIEAQAAVQAPTVAQQPLSKAPI